MKLYAGHRGVVLFLFMRGGFLSLINLIEPTLKAFCATKISPEGGGTKLGTVSLRLQSSVKVALSHI
jgi:hypothetical protein